MVFSGVKVFLIEQWRLLILLLFYGFGVIGINSPFQSLFLFFTPFNLLLSFLIIISAVSIKEKNFGYYVILSALCGYVFEVIGVKTGVVFGNYWYGQTLGLKFFEVPLTIALNWFLLSFATCSLVGGLKYSKYMKALMASLLMVGLDFLIEPIAMKLDFWQWENDIVPLHNYIGWLVIAYGVNLFFFQKELKIIRLAKYFYFIQLAFFLLLNLSL